MSSAGSYSEQKKAWSAARRQACQPIEGIALLCVVLAILSGVLLSGTVGTVCTVICVIAAVALVALDLYENRVFGRANPKPSQSDFVGAAE